MDGGYTFSIRHGNKRMGEKRIMLGIGGFRAVRRTAERDSRSDLYLIEVPE
jgi:hypothetical protein